MPKLSVSEAAVVLGITKEAIYNRIRRKTLKSVEENGVKYVIIDDNGEGNNASKTAKKEKKPSVSAKKTATKTATAEYKDGLEFIEFLLAQIGELKEQNLNLQKDKDTLFREKEKILVDNKNEISLIYKERDEKFRYFLQLLERPLLARQNGEYVRPIDVEISDIDTQEANVSEAVEFKKWISLSEFLKGLNLKDKKLKKIQNRIIKNIGKSKFIKFKDGVIWIRNEKTIKRITD